MGEPVLRISLWIRRELWAASPAECRYILARRSAAQSTPSAGARMLVVFHDQSWIALYPWRFFSVVLMTLCSSKGPAQCLSRYRVLLVRRTRPAARPYLTFPPRSTMDHSG
ncbi:hypothetical protein BJY01DRAFT_209502 [Aspergillus pseudoustus]|uniref:Uncharacterized protein n=1 Tax=Aspergillus pseudoustus TaxID=1810923 RepID=A0ABR4KFG4_9EURO